MKIMKKSQKPLNTLDRQRKIERRATCLSSTASDEGEDLTGKGDHDTAGDGEHTVGPLGGVVALEGQAQLEDAEAQQDQADGPDQGKDEVAQVLHDLEGVENFKGGAVWTVMRDINGALQAIGCALLVLFFVGWCR